MSRNSKVIEKHFSLFGPPALLVKAPGRVNIIGEHIDYNGGMVLPFTIDKHHSILFSKSTLEKDRLYSEGYGSFDSDQVIPGWGKYIDGALRLLRGRYQFASIDISIDGNLPIGAGLSSSSALVVGIIDGIDRLFDIGLEPEEKISLASEIEYGVGVKGGKMDQTVIVHGRKDHAILWDSKTDQITPIFMPEVFSWFVVDSDIKHDLADSDYNDRRISTVKILDLAKKEYGTEYLVDVPENSLSYLDINEEEMEMAFHVIYEQKRVLSVIECLENHKPEKLGAILNQSHQSLSTLYNVSTEEMDELVLALQRSEEVVGCRMIGGGFGGSILGLLKNESTAEIDELLNSYNKKYQKKATFFRVTPKSGVEHIIL